MCHYSSKYTHKEDYRKSEEDENKSRIRKNDFKKRMDDKGERSLYSSKAH